MEDQHVRDKRWSCFEQASQELAGRDSLLLSTLNNLGIDQDTVFAFRSYEDLRSTLVKAEVKVGHASKLADCIFPKETEAASPWGSPTKVLQPSQGSQPLSQSASQNKPSSSTLSSSLLSQSQSVGDSTHEPRSQSLPQSHSQAHSSLSPLRPSSSQSNMFSSPSRPSHSSSLSSPPPSTSQVPVTMASSYLSLPHTASTSVNKMSSSSQPLSHSFSSLPLSQSSPSLSQSSENRPNPLKRKFEAVEEERQSIEERQRTEERQSTGERQSTDKKQKPELIAYMRVADRETENTLRQYERLISATDCVERKRLANEVLLSSPLIGFVPLAQHIVRQDYAPLKFWFSQANTLKDEEYLLLMLDVWVRLATDAVSAQFTLPQMVDSLPKSVKYLVRSLTLHSNPSEKTRVAAAWLQSMWGDPQLSQEQYASQPSSSPQKRLPAS